MTCHETRELLSDLVDGALTPDEEARVEAHLGGCADCRKEHERFRATVTLLQRMERPRAPVGFVDRVLAAARPAPWYRRWLGRLFLPISVKLPAEAAAVLLVAGLAVFVFQRTPELQNATRQVPATRIEREQAPAVGTHAAPVGARPQQPAKSLPPSRVAPSPPTAPPPAAVATSPSPSSSVLVGGSARSRDDDASDRAKAKMSAAQEQQNAAPEERAASPADAKRDAGVAEHAPPVRQLADEMKTEALKKEADLGRKSAGAAPSSRSELPSP